MDLPIAADLHKSAGRRFYVGMSQEQTRCRFLSLGKPDANVDFTLSQAVDAAKKVLFTGTRELSGRCSDSESSDEDIDVSGSEDDSDSKDPSETEGKGSKRRSRRYSSMQGSVVNLMPESIADAMKLRKERGPGFNILDAEAAISGSGEDPAPEHLMDDDYGAHTSFDSQYRFLHENYFPRMAWSGLKLNPAKSHFWSKDLKLLGFAGSGEGDLRPSIDKVAAIRNHPVPSDVPWLERFLRISTKTAKNVIWGGDPTIQYHLSTDASTDPGRIIAKVSAKRVGFLVHAHSKSPFKSQWDYRVTENPLSQ